MVNALAFLMAFSPEARTVENIAVLVLLLEPLLYRGRVSPLSAQLA